MALQTTYLERHAAAVEGLIADSVQNNIVTRLCETSGGIGFGKAVSRGTKDKGVILGGTLAGFAGISVQDRTLVHPVATVDKYIPPENMGVLNMGMIWVVAGANVADGDPVYFNPTTGALSNSGGAASVGAAAAGAGNTGNGVVTLDGTPGGAGAVAGTWRAVLVEPVANGGIWSVFRPDGTREGEAITGTLYQGGIRFTIADGATDFAAGDEFSFAVTMAGVGPVPDSVWVDTTTQGELGRVMIGSMRS